RIARAGKSSLNVKEQIILAIEGLEREVNNGGYSLFFTNLSRQFAPMIVQALVQIGCPRNAKIAQRAIDALHVPSLTVEAIDAAMTDGEESEQELNECDTSYYEAAGEDIASHLFAFIKANKNAITF
ncbi:MAG: DMP19 family protein, partial [Candidatus Binatus sp.]